MVGRFYTVALISVAMLANLPVSDAQAWATGYPKLEFGNHMQHSNSNTPEVFPGNFGSAIPKGSVPQQLIFRFKSGANAVDKNVWKNAAGSSIKIELPGFTGADNIWDKDDTKVSFYTVAAANKAIATSTKYKANVDRATWSASTGILSITFGTMTDAEIATNELLVVIEATSFTSGKGPLPPKCLKQDGAIFVTEFKEDTTAKDSLMGKFASVSPIECFGEDKPVNAIVSSSWIVKKIGQNAHKNGIGMTSTIKVTLSSNFDLSSITDTSSKIEIRGLKGSQTSKTSTLAIASEPSWPISVKDIFNNDQGEWDQDQGKLTLTIADGKTLQGNVEYVFSFNLQLANAEYEANPVTIEGYTGTTVVIPLVMMESGAGNAAPLQTASRAFTMKKIGQSVSGPGQDNTLYITLMSNFNIQSTTSTTSKITVEGLVGSNTADSSSLNLIGLNLESRKALSDLSDAFNDGLATPNDNKVEWVQKTGKIVFHLATTKTFKAGEEYVISVEKLLNSNEAQDSPDVTVKLTGEVEVATVPMEKGMGEMAPFYISPPKLLVAKIGQSSCTLGASNTLTISLESNIGIQAIGAGSAAKVTISGLTGFADADSNVAVTPASYYSTDGIFTSNQAAWKKNDGTLILTLASGKRLHAGRLYVFKTTLTNPTDARAATELVTISLASSNNLIVSKEAEMSSDIKKMVLTVCAAGWDTLRIGQSKTGASTTNTISVTMKPNIVLNAGVNTKISISGLTNSGTADSGTLAIAGCGDVATSGEWTKSSGMLEFSPAKAWPAGTEYVCTFDLQSPSEIQEAATVTIKVDSYSTGQITPVIATSTFRNAPGNKGPFKIIDATFETAKIGQTMPYPGVTDNVITVTLKSNKPIGSTNSVVSAITISGLTGSQTADSSTLAITSITAGLANIIGTTGDWNKEKGELIISVVNNQQLAADTEYKLSFKLQNPEDKQESPAVMVSVSGGSAIAKMPMKSDMKGCIHNEGDTAPLFVYGRTFLVKKIGYRTTTPQAANVVTITLTTSISLSYQSGSATKITVSGISGMSTADSSTLAITSTHPTDFGKTAEWNKMDGSLIFTIQNGGSLAAGTTQYVLSAALSNGPDVDSPSPKIVSSGLGQKIAIEDMDMTGHYYEAPSVSMSTAADAVTAVQITFPAHKAIAKGDTLVVSLPGAGGDSTDAGDQIWGVKSLPDVFSVEATKTAYNDAIAHGDDVAMARFRAGDAGTVAGVSSENDGIKGSTMKLHKSNRDVFGHANVYAGQKLSIGGSDVEHLIVRQVAASTGADSSVDGHPAVAHFFPKYPGVAADDNVPAGTKYTIAAQLEFFAKAAVCEGTLISITVPASAGIKVPSNWASGAASVSLIRAGIPQAMQIGAATDAIEADVFVGATGREVSMQLDDATTADLHGYNFFPVQTVANDFTEIDGYRHIISNTDETYKVMTGYGPKKSSAVKEDAAAVALKQATPITDTNVNVGDKVWITLGAAVDAAVKPPSSKGSFGNNPVTGSFVQLLTTEEIMRYTGRSGKRVDSIAVPATSPGVACAKGGVNCAGVGCMTVTFSGTGNLNPCLQFPTADVTFTGGAISSFTMIDGGACTATQLQATLVKAEGVTCTTEPSGDTAATLAAASPVYEFERMQLGTSAGEVASCTFAAPCTAAKLVATDLHVDEGKLALDLLYTKSPKELAYANKQKLRINDATVVTTVAAGDYITTMSAPQEKGLCTKPDGGKCTGNDACVTVAVTGCAVNPAVTIEWEAAGVNAGKIKTMALRSGFDGVCESAADATVTFTVNDGYSCATMPACGNGCAATADTAKDIIHVLRPANNDGALSANQKILRVHDAQGTGSKYGVVLMPETPAKVIDLGVEGIIPAVMCVEMMPQAGKTYGFWSSVSFKMIVKVTANGDVPSLNVCDRPTDANFPMATYPAECATTGCAISPTGLSNSTRAQRRDLTTEYIASESFNLYIGGNNISGNASLKVDVPLVFNVNGSIPSRRRKAPAGYEYRLNGLCECPASDSDEVTCNVVTSGKYQAVLLSSTKCAPLPTGLSDGAIAGIVVGVLAAVLLMGLLWYCCRTPSTKEKNIEEGPVYVGRPVPLTPQQLAPSPMMIPMDYSAPLAAQGSPMMPTQLMEPLPNTYTPGSYPAQLMPMAGISGVPASPGLQQGTPMQYYVPASPQAAAGQSSAVDGSRIPYGV